jgi:ankyrin repeat protein
MSEFKLGSIEHVLSMCSQASAVPDAIGQTPLFYAVQRPSDSEACEVAERLIALSQLDPLQKDFGGQSPLFYAVGASNLETIKLLITKHNCPANESDNLSQTPLFYASRDGRIEIVKTLIESRADASHVDRNGQTALFYAARENRGGIVEYLLEQGARAEHVDAAGRQASYFARLAQHGDLADLLDSARGSVPEHINGRKRYRMVVVGNDGMNRTPSVEQLEWIESKFPEICVWSKTGPIATTVAVPGPVTPTPTSLGGVKRLSSAVPKKKDPTPAPPVWVTVARQMVSEIFKKEDAWIFLRPVDPLRDMCPDYMTMIAQPMDFGTIRKKLSKYASKAEFLADVGLVFSNCRTYNKPGTLPEVLGQRVELFWNDLVDRYSFHQLPDSQSPTKI